MQQHIGYETYGCYLFWATATCLKGYMQCHYTYTASVPLASPFHTPIFWSSRICTCNDM